MEGKKHVWRGARTNYCGQIKPGSGVIDSPEPCNHRRNIQLTSGRHPDARKHTGVKGQEPGSTAADHGIPAPGHQLILGRKGTRNDLAAHALASCDVLLAVHGV